jgi:hypothetical protein
MLHHLREGASDRKLMLFSAACLRRIWHGLLDERANMLVEATERFVDGRATGEEATQAYEAFRDAWENDDLTVDFGPDPAAVACVFRAGADAAIYVAGEAADFVGGTAAEALIPPTSGDRQAARMEARESAERAERAEQAALLRDIFGPLPFPPVPLAPSVLKWSDGLIGKLGQAAYDDRNLPAGTLDTARLAVLADALEEAGSEDAELLGHLRGQGPHVRGCWVLDLLLVRE